MIAEFWQPISCQNSVKPGIRRDHAAPASQASLRPALTFTTRSLGLLNTPGEYRSDLADLSQRRPPRTAVRKRFPLIFAISS
jgi:hypothetical protein